MKLALGQMLFLNYCSENRLIKDLKTFTSAHVIIVS